METTETDVELWRADALIALGFGPQQVKDLLGAGADHREAAALLAAGCPRELAVRILT